VRAPIAEGGGYAWFANRGIGRPVAESLSATMTWFRGWLDDVAPDGRPVVLVGFSGDADTVIPRELLDRTWSYLHDSSGAAVTSRRDPGGHGLSVGTVAALAAWIESLPHR
jgi:phospholipase/carboxylesterase